MLIYQTFATDELCAEEAAFLYPRLGIVESNMSPRYMEEVWQASGFAIAERDVVASEWREYWEESKRSVTSGQLLRIARMRRDRDRLVAEVGLNAFESELANCHWGVYQMLGKLCPMVYVLAMDPPAGPQARTRFRTRSRVGP